MRQDLASSYIFFRSRASSTLLLISLGIFGGLSYFFLPYSALLFGFITLIFIFINIFVSKEDRPFITRVFLCTLLLRLIIIIISYKIRGINFFGDEAGISLYAWQIKESIGEVGYPAIWVTPSPANIAKLIPVHLGDYGISSYTYWVTFLYFLYGYVPLLPKIVNIILGASTTVFAYLISKDIFSKRTARLSAILVGFFPSMIFLSTLNIKDTAFIFISMCIVWSFVKFFKTQKKFYLIFIMILIPLESTIRRDFWIAITLIVFLSGIVLLKKPLRKVVVCLFLAVFLALLILKSQFIYASFQKLILGAMGYHIGHVHTAGISYNLLPEKYYEWGIDLSSLNLFSLLNFIFKAVLYFLLVPFLWDIRSFFHLLVYPQVFAWYILLVFSFLGMLLCFKHKIRLSSILFFYLCLMTTNIALFSGNIGTSFRHRDMLSPFFLIFSAFGITSLIESKRDASGKIVNQPNS